MCILPKLFNSFTFCTGAQCGIFHLKLFVIQILYLLYNQKASIYIDDFFVFQSAKTSEDVISTPFNVTHLLHVNADNVEEFMSKLAESRTASTSKRPSVLKSRHKEKEKPKIEKVMPDNDGQNEQRIKNAPKAPARPVSCIPKVSSDQNFQRSESTAMNMSDTTLEQEIPPRPKQRPVSMTVTTGKDQTDGLQMKGESNDGATFSIQKDFEAPKPPPRRPPPYASSKPDKNVVSDESVAKIEADDLYSTIDETVRKPLKPRRSITKPNEGKSRPPLPPRRLPDKSTCREDESVAIVSHTGLQDVPSVSEKSDAQMFHDIGTPTDETTQQVFSSESNQPAMSEDHYSPVRDDMQMLDSNGLTGSTDLTGPNDVSDLYGVVNKPRSARSSLRMADDPAEFISVPLDGSSAPPLPPRTPDSFVTKGPPLPPRPSIE